MTQAQAWLFIWGPDVLMFGLFFGAIGLGLFKALRAWRRSAEEPTVTITRSQFWEAAEAVKVTVRDSNGYKEVSLREYLEWPVTGSRHLGELARKLGLGEP